MKPFKCLLLGLSCMFYAVKSFAIDNYYSTINYNISVPANSSGGSTTPYTINISVTPIGVYIDSRNDYGYNYDISFSMSVTISGYNGTATTFDNLDIGFYNTKSQISQVLSVNRSVALANGTKSYSFLTNQNNYVGGSNSYIAGQTYQSLLTELGYNLVNIDVQVAGHSTTLGANGTNGENGSLSNTNSTAISRNSTALPVSLSSFSATRQSNTVVINWSTASEINNAGFYVLHGTDINNLQSLGYVASKANNGNSQIAINYDKTDYNPITNYINYYQLKQVDLDGKATLSKVINVDLRQESTSSLSLYPNPVRGNNVTIANTTIGTTIQVLSIDGRIFLSQKVNSLPVALTLPNLPSGIYLVKSLDSKGKSESLKFIKQ